MVFDTEKQRQIILELLSVSSIPGKALELLYQFKQEVLQGTLAQPVPPGEPKKE